MASAVFLPRSLRGNQAPWLQADDCGRQLCKALSIEGEKSLSMRLRMTPKHLPVNKLHRIEFSPADRQVDRVKSLLLAAAGCMLTAHDSPLNRPCPACPKAS